MHIGRYIFIMSYVYFRLLWVLCISYDLKCRYVNVQKTAISILEFAVSIIMPTSILLTPHNLPESIPITPKHLIKYWDWSGMLTGMTFWSVNCVLVIEQAQLTTIHISKPISHINMLCSFKKQCKCLYIFVWTFCPHSRPRIFSIFPRYFVQVLTWSVACLPPEIKVT